MSAPSIEIGTIIQLEGIKYAVKNIGARPVQTSDKPSSASEQTVLVLRDTLTDEIRILPYSEFYALWEKGALRLINVSLKERLGERHAIAINDLPAADQEIIRFRRRCIETLEALGKGKRTQEELAPVIEKLNLEAPIVNKKRLTCSVNSIYRWRKILFNTGGDAKALIRLTNKCGRKGDPRLPEEIEAIIDEVIAEAEGAGRRLQGEAIYELVAVAVNEGKKSDQLSQKLRIPSKATISRRIRGLSPKRRHRTTHNPEETEEKFRQHGQMIEPEHILDLLQLDFTPSEATVVDEADYLPMGAANLCSGIEAKTRCIWGFDISPFGEGYLGLIGTLLQGIRMKPDVQTLYKTKHSWDVYGRPRSVCFDHGPGQISESIIAALFELGVAIDYHQRRRPGSKAYIERFWWTVAQDLLGEMPGSRRYRRREDLKNTCIFYDDLIPAYTTWIVDWYHQKPHRGLRGAKPGERWLELTQGGFAPPLPESIDQLRTALGYVAWRRVWDYGIDFEGLRYNSTGSELLQARIAIEDRGNPQAKGRSDRNYKIKLKVDPDDITQIQVFDPFEKRYLIVPIIDRDRDYATGLTLYKHRYICKQLPTMRDDENTIELGEARKRIQDRFAKALGRKKSQLRKLRKRLDYRVGDGSLGRSSPGNENREPDSDSHPNSPVDQSEDEVIDDVTFEVVRRPRETDRPW